MIRKGASLAFFILLCGCSSSEPCEENSCFTPPNAVILEIVDAQSGEDMFANGTFRSQDIVLLNEDQKQVAFQFVSENNTTLLYLNIGWETGTHEYILFLGPEQEISISLNSELKSGNCCSFYLLSNFSFTNYNFERSPVTGNFKIFVN